MNIKPKKYILLTSEDRKILERVRAKHRCYVGHTAVVETQDVRDAAKMLDLTIQRQAEKREAA